MAVKQVNAVKAMEEFCGGKINAASLCEAQGAWLAMTADGAALLCAYKGSCPEAAMFVKAASGTVDGITVDSMELNPNNAAVVRRFVKWAAPQAQGGKGISVAFTDWLGAAGAYAAPQFKLRQARPVLVDYAAENADILKRNFLEAVDAATWGALELGYKEGYGANAAGLKTEEEIVKALLYGYSMIGFDCSEKIDLTVEAKSDAEVAEQYGKLPQEFRDALKASYLDADFKVGEGVVHFTESMLQRIILEFGEAIMHIQYIYNTYLNNTPWQIDFELKLAKPGRLLTQQELYLISNELQRNGIKLASLELDGAAAAQDEGGLAAYGEIAATFGYRLSIADADLYCKDLGTLAKNLKGQACFKMTNLLWLAALQTLKGANCPLLAEMAQAQQLPEFAGAEILPGSANAVSWAKAYKGLLKPEAGFAAKIKEGLKASAAAYRAQVEALTAQVLKSL